MISSRQNPIFKKLLSLTKSKGIKEEGECLVSGEKITSELANNKNFSSYWVCNEKQTLPEGDWNKTILLSSELFKEVDILGTQKPLLILTVPELKEYSQWNSQQPTLFCSLSDPNNFGAVIRSSVAFGIEQAVILKEACHPFLPKAIRSSSGSCFHISFFTGPSINDLKVPDLIALDMGGENIKDFKFPKTLHLLIGEEGLGVPKGFTGQRVHIPISSKVESLNAGIATSILLYEWQNK